MNPLPLEKNPNFVQGYFMSLKMLPDNFPKVVCFCGSSKFKEEFEYAAQVFTYHGWIVLSMCYFTHYEKTKDNPTVDRFDRIKLQLDELHKRKIDLVDLVFIIDVGGYVGDSTKSEIAYAIEHNKPLAYWRTSEVNLNKLVLK